MYEQVLTLWKTYRISRTPLWPSDDPRADLAAEVENRLEQLDLVLEHLHRYLRQVRPDPETSKRDAETFLREAERFSAGQITQDEYVAIIKSRSPMPSPHWARAWSEVRLFTEVFYFVAWRIREILSASGPNTFSELGSVDFKGIRTVRNILLQHPEHGRPQPNYSQALVVTDDGPVLKSSSFLVKGGRVKADPDSVDRGLFRNAEELRDELTSRLTLALAQCPGIP